MKKTDREGCIAVAVVAIGVGLLGYACFMIWRPLGYAFCGLFLVVVGIAGIASVVDEQNGKDK